MHGDRTAVSNALSLAATVGGNDMEASSVDMEDLKKRLSSKTFELFLCMYNQLDGLVAEEEIEITSETDYLVSVKLISKNKSKLNFTFDFYADGWFDFLIDTGVEVTQMAEFKSHDEASEYFAMCLKSKIKKQVVKKQSGQILKTDYYFIVDDTDVLAIGEFRLSKWFMKTETSTEIFPPWVA